MKPAKLVEFEKKAQMRARIVEAKQKRFTLASRILSAKNINVKVVDDVRECPAWIDMHTLDLTLNEARPRANNKVAALIYDRGKMFHEIDHAEFTTGIEHREKLGKKSKNPKAFLDLSNVLEDGRIERCGREKWQGTGDYLDALLSEVMKEANDSQISGLVLYVRTKIFRNQTERNYWQPYIDKIDKAVAADTTREAMDIAFDIVEALADKSPEQPKGGQGEQQGDKGQGQGESQSGEGSESREDDAKGDSDASESKDSQDEGKESGESDKVGNGLQSGHETNGEIDEEVQEKIEQIVESAIDNVREEAKEELDAILEEANGTQDTTQQYEDSEESTADELASMFDSLLVEQNRVKYTRSREGMLNTLALTNALTNRKCFQLREESIGAPYVALLLDTSGSMGSRASDLTQSARIIHGALQKANVNVRMIEFGHAAKHLQTVPLGSLPCPGMSTQTGLAMQLANDWLEEQGASRALMIVVTDGAPDCYVHTEQQKARCEANNGYVLGVRAGMSGNPRKEAADLQWHDYVNVVDVSTLPQVLQPKLESFIAGE